MKLPILFDEEKLFTMNIYDWLKTIGVLDSHNEHDYKELRNAILCRIDGLLYDMEIGHMIDVAHFIIYNAGYEDLVESDILWIRANCEDFAWEFSEELKKQDSYIVKLYRSIYVQLERGKSIY